MGEMVVPANRILKQVFSCRFGTFTGRGFAALLSAANEMRRLERFDNKARKDGLRKSLNFRKEQEERLPKSPLRLRKLASRAGCIAKIERPGAIP
jgi:hypothetical protein